MCLKTHYTVLNAFALWNLMLQFWEGTTIKNPKSRLVCHRAWHLAWYKQFSDTT